MQCTFCKSKGWCVKNGRDRKGDQRYKCQTCKRTFTKATIDNMIASEKKRLVLHLILAGCKTEGISEVLGITEKIIKRWEKLHLKELKGVLPEQSLLAIHTLLKIYNAIEKKRIAAIHFSSWRKNRLRRN